MNSLTLLTFCKIRYIKSLHGYPKFDWIYRCSLIKYGKNECHTSTHIKVEKNGISDNSIHPYPKNVLKNFINLSLETLEKKYNYDIKFYKEGQDHAPHYRCSLHLAGLFEEVFHGSGSTKKTAEANAASKAILKLYKAKLMNSKGVPIQILENSGKLNIAKNEIVEMWKQKIPLSLPDAVLNEAEDLIRDFHNIISPLMYTEDVSSNIKDEMPRVTCMMTGRAIRAGLGCRDRVRDSDLLRARERGSRNEQSCYAINRHRNEILKSIEENAVTIIEGHTGCGKSSQVPQMIFDEWVENGRGSVCNIVVAQPRRLATLSLAEWVARERGEKLGGTVGYKMRLDEVTLEKRGGVMFYTNGSLRELIRANPDFEGVSHVIVDEIHERSMDSDLLLLLVKRALVRCPHVKFVLMSATARVADLMSYLDVRTVVRIPEGNRHPIHTRFLDDFVAQLYPDKQKQANALAKCSKSRNPCLSLDLIHDLVLHIHRGYPQGAVLVFLPGWNDIKALQGSLMSVPDLRVSPLHSRLSKASQAAIFAKGDEAGRKVILATNIAETSITVDDVVYVVDSGLQNDSRYIPTKNINTFGTVWITKANAVQRQGRAGRVGPGEVFRLYSRKTFDALNEFPVSEMQKLPLEAVVLRCMAMFEKEDIRSLLEELIEPPSAFAVEKSLETLVHLQILSKPEIRPSDFNAESTPESRPSDFKAESNLSNPDLASETSSSLSQDSGCSENDRCEMESTASTQETLTSLGRKLVAVSTTPIFSKAMVYCAFGGFFGLGSNYVAMENRTGGVFADEISSSRVKMLKMRSLVQETPLSDLVSSCFLLEAALDQLIPLHDSAADLTDSDEESDADRVGSTFSSVNNVHNDLHQNELIAEFLCPEKVHNVRQVKNLFRRQVEELLPQFVTVQRDHTRASSSPAVSLGLGRAAGRFSTPGVFVDLLTAGFLSSANTIIRSIKRKQSRPYLFTEDGSKVLVHGSSVFSDPAVTWDDSLYFSMDLFHSQSRNVSVARELTSVTPLSVALFYGERLEWLSRPDSARDHDGQPARPDSARDRDDQPAFLKIANRNVFFSVPDKRRAQCIMDLRNMWTKLLDYFLRQESSCDFAEKESKLVQEERVFRAAQIVNNFLSDLLNAERNKLL